VVTFSPEHGQSVVIGRENDVGTNPYADKAQNEWPLHKGWMNEFVPLEDDKGLGR
jgi:hypothetical protein